MYQPFQGIRAIAHMPLADTAEILRDDSEYGCDVRPYSSVKQA